MTTVWLGNPNPMMQVAVPVLDAAGNALVDPGSGAAVTEQRSVPAPHLNQTVTTILMRDAFDNAEDVELTLSTRNDILQSMIGGALGKELRRYAVGVAEVYGSMGVHSDGHRPDWVSSDDPKFAAALAKFFDCPVGEPQMLQTFAGRDALHNQHLGPDAAVFNFMAVSESTVAPSTGSTVLPGEITTAGGGLLRKTATFAHSAGTNTSTLSATFTANASDVLPKTIAKLGIFNASAAGTLGYETLINAVAQLAAVGDSTTLTDTLTIG